ncbi:glycerophosphoryl diester phosphodiesterase [Nitrobacteraceae bacterium AZCC 1564]
MADITLYGHRGGGDPYPDSTRESYIWGMNWGADFVEPDCYLTKDGVLVVSHDNIAGGFANITYAEALKLNPALLTLGQLIDLVKQYSIETGRNIGIIPETKSTDYATSEAMVKTFIEHDFTDPSRVIIQSFSATNLHQLHDTIMKQYGVDFQLVQLSGGISNPNDLASYVDIIAPSVGSFTKADVDAAHAAGLKVVAWTLNGASQADIQKLEDMGVDGVFVDNMQAARPNAENINNVHVIYGTPEWNAVNDTAGDDMVYAMQGDDIVRASTGNDTLYGDGGNDVLFGGAGNDHLVGGAGTDYLSGGDGANVLDGSAGNDVIVATGSGDQVLFNTGSGIDLVTLNDTTTVKFGDIKSTDVTVTEDNGNLIIRANANDALVIHGTDAAHLPASITFADGVTWTSADLLSHATQGADAAVEAALPGLEYVGDKAPALATPSTIAIGTDLVANDGIGNGHLVEHVENAENGAIYRLSFSLSDLAGGDDAGVKVLWNGQVIYEGTPEGAAKMHFVVTGGSGDGSNQLVFEGAGADPSVFDASLTDVHLVKLADPGVPVPNNAAPDAADGSAQVSQDIAITGKLTATDANGDPVVFSLGDGPQHGTLTFKADGSYVYTPNAGYTGADSFTYVVNDGHGGVDEATMNLSVKPGVVIGTDLVVNGSFEDTSASTGYNGSGDWGYRNPNGVIAGWTDVNGNRIEQHWDSPNGVVAKDGTIFIDMDGYNTNTDIVQTIAHVETGATYRLSFSLGDADTAVSDDGIRVFFGGQLVYEGVPTNPWQTFNFTVVGGSGDGSNKLEFIATGTNLNTYGAALDDVHFVKIAEAVQPPENHAPDAADGTVEGHTNEVITGKLTATDPDGDIPLTFGLKDGAAHGTVVVKADGTYEYTANAGYTGTDTFTFTVSDGHGGTDIATQHVKIDPALPPAPVNLIVNGGFEDLTGANDAASWGFRNTNPAGVIAGWANVADNRAEVHKDTVGSIKAVEGTYWFDMEGANKNAKLVQTVAGVEQGETYQLKFSIADTDTAQTNDTIKVYWGGQVIYTGTPQAAWQEITIDVVGGAGDGSNQLAFESTTPNSNGAGVALDNISMIKIDENPNLIINGSFEDLTGVNDPATWGYRNDKPAVIAGWTDIGTAKKIELHGPHAQDTTNNPVDAADGKYYIDTVGASAGTNIKLAQTVQGVEAGRTYKLTFSLADGDKSHSDQGVNVYWGGKLVYSTSPGFDPATGTIAPGAAAGQPTPPNGQTWQEIAVYVTGGETANGGVANQLVFEGTGNASGNNGAELDDVSLRLVNSAPVAVNDTLPNVKVDGQPILISVADLLGNDTDVDHDQLTITGVKSAVGGTVTLDADGIHFTPASGFTGEASFQYTISDGQGGTSTGEATFTIKNGDVEIAAGQVQMTPILVDGDMHITVGGTLLPVSADRAIDAKDVLPDGTTLKIDVLATGQIMSSDDAIRVNHDLTNGHVIIDNAGRITSQAGNAIDLKSVISASTEIVINNEATGVILASNADAIRGGANTVINNYGQITSQQEEEDKNDAIDFQDDGRGTVNNYTSGLISGAHHAITGAHGITVNNDVGGMIIGNSGSAVNIDNTADVSETVTVVNHGSMIGAAHEGYTDSDGDAIDVDGLLNLDNYGEVRSLGAFGYHDGEVNVSEGIAAGGGTIHNHVDGVIYGYGRAIQIDNSSNGPAAAATTIINEGLIQGDGHGPANVAQADADVMQQQIDGREAIDIIGSFGDTIFNSGKIIGGIFTDGGTDSLTNTGIINGQVDMGSGDDTVTLNDGSQVSGTIVLGEGNDTLMASANAVTVDGGAGDDHIAGGAGNDTLHGGAGNDTLAGGDGSDTYTYSYHDGDDVITEGSGQAGDTDSLVFTEYGDGPITLYKHGNDLEIVIENDGKITVTDQFAGSGVETIAFDNGIVWDHDAIAAHLTDRGPVAEDVTLPTVSEDAQTFVVSFDKLLAGASDADLDTLFVNGVADFVGGKAVLTADGVEFTLDANYNGTASFSFTVDDGRGGAAVAHASFDVTPVNDAPVVVNDTGEVQVRDTATFDLVHNDTDVEDGQPHLAGFTVTGVDGVNVSIDAATSAFHIVNGQLVYDGGDIFSSLPDGQQATVTINYTASDNDGGHSDGQFVLTIDGLNPVSGTNGADVLSDTTGADHISAGAGNDIIFSSFGDDVIDAGTGNDTVMTQTGDNIVNGGDGNDTITGGLGASTLNGDAGNDAITGGLGSETINGGDGNDTLIGGAGQNVISGGEGNDSLFGGVDDSVLDGDAGNDTINGGLGNETINGGAGNDMLLGGGGNDVIWGGAGNDQMFGGLGSDTFVFKTGGGHDTVFDFQAQGTGHDVIELDHSVFADFDALMASGAVHDAVGGVDIAYADGSTLTLTGVTKASLKVDDFHFA